MQKSSISENTLYVGGDGPGNYTSIQDAINDANDGDTVFVYSGIYSAEIIVNKAISLIGENQENTIIEWGDDGISIYADEVTVMRFTIQNCGGFWHRCGIYITSDYNTISEVSIINNGVLNGIFLEESYYNNISNNIIENNLYHGIRLQYSSDNIIGGNRISNVAAWGIVLSNSNSNEIYLNTISQCDWGGIGVVSNCNDNKLYHNNLIDNDISNSHDDGISTWDDGYPSGGNFWSDYMGEDNNSDGIGDKPYNIPGGENQDRYPLINPCGENLPPKPPVITGPKSGKVGAKYNYSFVTRDLNGDSVFYLVQWGENSVSLDWIGPYPSGEEVILNHTYNQKGTYTIYAKAKDTYDAESDWGILEVTMTRNKITYKSLFVNLFDRFTNFFPILRYIIILKH